MKPGSLMLLLSLPLLAACEHNADNIPPPDRGDPDMHIDTGGDGASDVPEEPPCMECHTPLCGWEPLDERAWIYGSSWWVRGLIEGSYSEDGYAYVLFEVEYSDISAPGIYPIEERIPFNGCSTCIFVWEMCYRDTRNCHDHYALYEGTLEITTIDSDVGGRIAGQLTGAHFIEIVASTDELMPSGLSYCIDVWDFDLEIMADNGW